uniref:PX domain-containing protein n=1 Tax=Oryzias sinensis TaxID=183150 RepID=A0A8C7X5F7_9TELE
AGVCNDHGKTYALYTITVFRRNSDGNEDCWITYRRYSDFHDFHMRIICNRYSLNTFIRKKTFNNMDRDFLEKRKKDLNAYLQVRTFGHPCFFIDLTTFSNNYWNTKLVSQAH